MAKKKFKGTILEASRVVSNMETLMLCKEIGVKTSLLLHRNVKLVKPFTDDYDVQVKLIEKQCYETDEQGNLKFNDENKPTFLPGKLGEYKTSVEELNKTPIEVDFEVLDLSKLPEKLGKIQETEFFQFVPPLFDIIYVEEEEYKELGT